MSFLICCTIFWLSFKDRVCHWPGHHLPSFATPSMLYHVHVQAFFFFFKHGLWKLNSGPAQKAQACFTTSMSSFFSLCSNLHLRELSYQPKATQLVGESNRHEQVPLQLHHAVWWIMTIGPTPWLWLWIKGKQEMWASG